MTASLRMDFGGDDVTRDEFEAKIQAMRDWLDEFVGLGGFYDPILASDYKWIVSISHVGPVALFTFKDPRRAVLFKMTWG